MTTMKRPIDRVAVVLAAGIIAAWIARSLAPESDEGAVWAYIGPGAGVALAGTFFAAFMAMLAGLVALVTFPIRFLWRVVLGKNALKKAQVKRVVVLGLDGLEPTLTEKFLEEGILPNLAKLRAQGSYMRLGTTWPPLSPVAWSSFSTGTNPGKHNIFDFLNRTSDYRPTISSVRIREARKTLKLGPFVIPLSKPEFTQLRKSKPFWCVLSESGVTSAVLRVPITFPPDKFRGVQLSAMCVPDLRGTQGMFSYYVEQGPEGSTTDGDVGGDRIRVERDGAVIRSFVRGPVNTLRSDKRELRVPFVLKADGRGGVNMDIGAERIKLSPEKYTEWVRVTFDAAPGIKVRGIVRFYLKRFEAPFEMYATAVQIDPRYPAMPISQPATYASYLASMQGAFATLGLAEDTWSLSEKLMSEEGFLEQAYDIHQEREEMFFDALRRVRQGLVVCVFDGPDRIQHMFWRFLDKQHPAADDGERARHGDVIREMYRRMDDLVGRTMRTIDDKHTALFVMSDHGFKPFRRGVDLNAWLRDNGYLKLKDGASRSDKIYLGGVDWSQTKAYAIGLAGIFLNLQGREKEGIVPAAEAAALAREIKDKLTGARDEERGEEAVHEVMVRDEVYRGPYVTNAPDLIVGYNVGYRVSWDAAVGKCSANVYSDNLKAWSGDHCVHPKLVPGVLFANRPLNGDGSANIVDMAPTALALFGLRAPAYMEGKSLLRQAEAAA